MRRAKQLETALFEAIEELDALFHDGQIQLEDADHAVDYHEWIVGLRDVLQGRGRVLH